MNATHTLRILLATLALAGAAAFAREAPVLAPFAEGVRGIDPALLTPGFWIERLGEPDKPILDRVTIQRRNARLLHDDPSMHDLRALPPTLERAQVAAWIGQLSDPPTRPLHDAAGKPVARATLDAIVANRNLEAIPDSQPTRYGLVVARADLRAFPTDLRVFSEPGDTDIDRFQESALFPGTPVVPLHESRDGRWLFVLSPRYAAWVLQERIALGSAEEVFGYTTRTPYRVVTGATAATVFTPEQPALSRLQLDMGLRL
ncbi:MAG TPA: SH3 domain-containing protein, partial [Dokdonella sp.]